ncbi:3105_t:CDS:2 [Cetraspora pellucida]|uniref:3105_t:CDS:1 n=1 Tax=Cetraspora pellucida TaxID=1433469 RepID=A0ACA9KS20_9GLOM|nr:3105_t:CDS:2 [Cetraspora pellucida]
MPTSVQVKSDDFGTIQFVSSKQIEWYQNHLILITIIQDIVYQKFG